VAEIELDNEQQSFPVPEWIGTEVTGDSRYYNAALCREPFSTWHDHRP
jgi:CYTH domain-containing protein